MVAPGFLTDPEVRRWLGDIEPAWTMLDLASIRAIRQEPSRENRALSMASDLTDAEIATSAIAHNTLILLEKAASDGLKLTDTGNLARSVVAEFARGMKWPAFDLDLVFRVCKVVNEPDLLPLYFIRHLAQLAKLVRRHRGRLKATVLGKEIRTETKRRSLQAILFHLAFWHTDLGFFGGGMLGSWPQADIGVLLWSLSVAATDWQTPEKLARLCAIPAVGMPSANWDVVSVVTEARVLRPLVWYGLLEQKPENASHARFLQRSVYRKAPLFDRFLAFNVRTEHTQAVRH
jgi:hypothetical protein